MRTAVRRDRRRAIGWRRCAAKQVPLLLAYLLLNRARPVGREELIGALWPHHAPVSQDAALRTLLSRLRSALGDGSLQGRDELMLELPEPVWIDLEAAALGGRAGAAGARPRGRPERLGVRPGAAQHRQPRPAPRRPGDLARGAPARARGHPPAGARGDRPGGAAPRRRAALPRSSAHARSADRGRALPRVGLRAADGGARRARATSPRGCACSTGCGRSCATSSGRRPSPETIDDATSACSIPRAAPGTEADRDGAERPRIARRRLDAPGRAPARAEAPMVPLAARARRARHRNPRRPRRRARGAPGTAG